MTAARQDGSRKTAARQPRPPLLTSEMSGQRFGSMPAPSRCRAGGIAAASIQRLPHRGRPEPARSRVSMKPMSSDPLSTLPFSR